MAIDIGEKIDEGSIRAKIGVDEGPMIELIVTERTITMIVITLAPSSFTRCVIDCIGPPR